MKANASRGGTAPLVADCYAPPPRAMDTERYTTLAGEQRHEVPKIKGSRFLATVAPAASDDEARAVVARVRKEHHDARHHAWAYRLGPGAERFRWSDDGEPGGSAGKPILQALEGRNLTDTVAVVTRWFGGTKLGVGGLVRAYGGAAAAALDLAPVRVVTRTRCIVLAYPYSCSSPVKALLDEFDLVPSGATYAESVRLVIDVPLSRADAFAAAFVDRTAGRGTVTD